MIIAVPLYRAPELIGGLFDALAALADEIAEIGGHILLVNDSPDDAGLRAALGSRLPALSAALPVELIENDENLGFVRSANLALARGRDSGEDVILLNSDTLPAAGAFREMAAVAHLDPMTAVVSPRSNNATICNSPYPEHFRGRDPATSLRDHEAIAGRLPRVTYVPTAVGFCLYIRTFVLREFGLFDEIYGKGYNEENDFIRRCNRRGYRAVLANRAFVFHIGNASFTQSEGSSGGHDTANRRTLDQRYPEYDGIVRRHYAGPRYRAEYLASGLIPNDDGRLRILFDCRLMGAHHNGTSELACHLLANFAAIFADEFDVAVLIEAAAFAHHRLDDIPGLRRCDAAEARSLPFAAVFRIGQPFTRDDLAIPFGLGAVVGFLMLDTIALDCQQLDVHDLDDLWGACASEADIVAHISRFSRDQFRRRFSVRKAAIETVALCSTDIADYRPASIAARTRNDGRTILIVGNHYPHKALDEAVAGLRAEGDDIRVTILGGTTGDEDEDSHAAGELAAETVETLYRNADIVLFPSHYEGFGLPILHALAHRKPVVARRRPAAIEIAERTPYAANLHLFDTLDEMVAAALALPGWTDIVTSCAAPPQAWSDMARQIGTAIRRAIARYDHGFQVERQRRLSASSPQQRLRTLPAKAAAQSAPAGPVRPDFQEIAAMLDAYHSHGEVSWLDRLFRGGAPETTVCATLDESTDTMPDGIDSLDLTAAARDGLRPLQADLQRWVQRIATGGRLLLRIEHAEHIDTEFGLPTIDSILILLVGAGCVPLSRHRDGAAICATAVKLMDWRESYEFPGDDRAFAAYCYSRILGREGDAGGIDVHTELAVRHGRAAIANAFYQSQERIAHIRSRLAPYFGN